MYQIELEQFSGPLDLLLQLIETEKLDISQVSLAKVTDQYLSYLEQAENISATELADFLLVATKLLVIKSKIILPQLNDDEEDSAEELAAQLKIYKDYLDACRQMTAIIGQGQFCFSREKIAANFEPAFSPPANLRADDLAATFAEIINRIDYVVNLPQKVMAKAISLREVVDNIRNRLKQFEQIRFREVLSQVHDRHEIVICFMALLELIKNNEVAVTQKGVFDDIMVTTADQKKSN